MEEKNQNQVVKLSTVSSPRGLPAPWSDEDREKLAIIIGMVFDLQKQYGKTSEQLKNIVAGFCWALKPYPVEKIIDGIRQYITAKSDIPTPSDIKNIIDPQKEPFRPDWKVYERYKKLKEEGGKYALNEDEEKYMLACEEYSLSRLKS